MDAAFLSNLYPSLIQTRYSQQPLAASELLLQVFGSIALKKNMLDFSIRVKYKELHSWN